LFPLLIIIDKFSDYLFERILKELDMSRLNEEQIFKQLEESRRREEGTQRLLKKAYGGALYARWRSKAAKVLSCSGACGK